MKKIAMLLMVAVLGYASNAFATEKVEVEIKDVKKTQVWVDNAQTIIDYVCAKTGVAAEKAWQGFDYLVKEYQVYHITACVLSACFWLIVVFASIKYLPRAYYFVNKSNSEGLKIGFPLALTFIVLPALINPIIIFGCNLAGACMPHVELIKEILSSVKG